MHERREAREIGDPTELVVRQVEVPEALQLFDRDVRDQVVSRLERLESRELLEIVEHNKLVVREVELLQRRPFDGLQPFHRPQLEVGMSEDQVRRVPQLVQLATAS